MASDEARKKWGTIFMGDREASVEQLKAMQEPVLREKRQKEAVEDYMERVRAKAADRAKEILGAAYAERQKVLEEAKNEVAAMKRQAIQECARLKAEGETARQTGQSELDKAAALREEAEKIRDAAHEEGFQQGMDDAGRELQEFRGELGQAVGTVLRAVERQRKNILDTWRQELVEVTRCAVQAGCGFVLDKELETILRSLVSQSLDMLENRAVVTARVNPDDEAAVSDMFRAARERVPELRQWIVTGDSSIERGGLIAESGSGSVDLRRENFRDMVDGVLAHLALPDHGDSQAANEVEAIVEREVANIAALTPEPDQPAVTEEMAEPPAQDAAGPEIIEEEALAEDVTQERLEPPLQEEPEPVAPVVEPEPASHIATNYDELEEELFPLEENVSEPAPAPTAPANKAAPPKKEVPETDPNILAEGGFL